jgi:DNA-binding NarL/FixJ family response regulator
MGFEFCGLIRTLNGVSLPENEMLPIRILLASHQPIIRSGLRSLLEREAEFRVVAEAANGREAIVLSEYKHPDVALLDMKLPLVNGIAVAKQIASISHSPAAVFVSSHTDQSYVHEAFKAGARGYVDGDSAPSDLSRAIRVVARGRLFLSPAICSQMLEPHLIKGNISEHEKALWCFIAAGYEELEIAHLLNTDSKRVRLDSHSLKSLFCRNSLPDVIAQSIFLTQTAFSQ